MSINIIPLSEGIFTIGHDKIFIPFDESKDDLNSRSIGSLLVDIQPFLIQTKGKNILFDTGLGFSLPSGELQLYYNLRRNGIEPADIHMVILSHLHKDHAGGIVHTNGLGIKELCFPNATYYVSKKEFEFAMDQGLPSYHCEDFDILKNSSQVDWLEDQGTIHPSITYEKDGGHCPFHTSFLINSDSEHVFYGGDVAPQLKQLKTRYIAKYDFDGRLTMELRQEYAKRGHLSHWTFLFYHDVKTPYSKL